MQYSQGKQEKIVKTQAGKLGAGEIFWQYSNWLQILQASKNIWRLTVKFDEWQDLQVKMLAARIWTVQRLLTSLSF